MSEFLPVLPQSIAATQLGRFCPLSENYWEAPAASEPGMSGTEPSGVSRRSWLTTIVRADGSIDFRERNAVIGVAEGDLIGKRVPVTAGTHGSDVLGKELPA